MALLHSAPTTALGRAVREERSAAREAKRHNSWWRRIFKGIAVTFIALFAALGIGGGTAQAWPWDDLVTAVYYICGPMDVPTPVTYEGFDTSLGLNNVDNSDQRKTIVPKMEDGMDDEGNGLNRLREQFSGDDYNTLAKPTYERYGFSTLVWTNYGNGCASKAFWLSGVTNFAFDIFVKFPMILGMGLLEWTMNPENILYQAFAAIIQPIISVFTAIFTPWIFFIAPIGVFLIWVKTRSTMQVSKAFIWVVCIYGVFLWMGNNTSRVVSTANNFVTEFAGSAACKISETSGGGQACDPDNPMGNIMESLWHGIPYQTWLAGELGEDGARSARAAEENGDISWGGAILNGLYVGDDDAGRDVIRGVDWWNAGSYAANTDADAKVGYWTGGDANLPDWSKGTAWEDVPFLANVKFMCNDKSTDGDGWDDEEYNRWMYGGQCDTAGAGTSDIVPYFKGAGYSQQIVYAFAGMWAVIAIVLTIGLACIYLMLQKMLFYWLLAFGPIFLAISTFADEKRRQFAKRYFELLIANVIKQCVAVCAVLFVSYSMSTLLYPPPSSGIPEIPWIVKPYAAIIFMIALIMFAKPMSNIMTAAVKGDASVVDKMANAPKDAAAATAKAAVVAGAIAATGGAAAAAAPGVLGGTSLGGAAMGGGKAGAALLQAGKVAGSRGGVGRAMVTAGRLMNMKQGMADAAANKEGAKRALDQGVSALVNGPGGDRFERDKNGNLTKQGRKDAENAVRSTIAQGSREQAAQKAQAAHMEQFFSAYKTTNGGQHHPADPKHPDNVRAAAVAAEKERLSVRDDAKGEQSRENNSAPMNERVPSDQDVRDMQGHEPGTRDGDGVFHMGAASAHFAEQARERFEGPSYARDENIRPNITLSGEDVLQGLNLSLAGVAANPERLVTGENAPYQGGNTANMDPSHPATGPLTELRFAMANGSEQQVQEVAVRAADAIEQAGSVPNVVSGTYSTGETARSFESVQVVGAMPSLSQDTPWEERAAGAVTMQQAVASIPEGHPAAEATHAYVDALSTPSVDSSTVEGLRFQAIQAFEQSSDWQPAGVQAPLMGVEPETVAAGVAGVAAGAAFSGNSEQPYVEPTSYQGSHTAEPPADYDYEPPVPDPYDAPVDQGYSAPSAPTASYEQPTAYSGNGDHDPNGLDLARESTRALTESAPSFSAPSVAPEALQEVAELAAFGLVASQGASSAAHSTYEDAPAWNSVEFADGYQQAEIARAAAQSAVERMQEYQAGHGSIESVHQAAQQWESAASQHMSTAADMYGTDRSEYESASQASQAAQSFLSRISGWMSGPGDEPVEEARDVPRGEQEVVAEYNNPSKKRRSGIFGYDDEDGDNA